MTQSTPQDQLTRMITGYWISQLVYTAAELSLADLVAEHPRTADELATATQTHPGALYRLLRALASVGVFSEGEGGRFSLTPLAELLRTDVPGSQRAAVLMMVGQFYEAWGNVLGSVRSGRPAFELLHGQRFFEFLGEHPDQARIFDDAMTAFNDRKSRAVLDAYDFSSVSVLADIGGGNGENLAATLRRFPAMRGVLFDLPDVVEEAVVSESGLEDRCQVIGGSFLESVPEGADAYLLRHIVHNWDDEHAVTILQNVRRTIDDRGKLLVVERVIPPGNEPMFGKLTDMTMLVVHGGKERTDEEYRRLFESAGFRLTRVVTTALDVSVIEGVPEGTT